MARPQINIDWEKVGKMVEADCTATGIAAVLGCDRDTLYTRCKRDLKMDFTAFCQQRRAKGDDLLRMKQYQTAMSGNVVMQIWLGKQRLGQRDKAEVEQSGMQKIIIEWNDGSIESTD